MCWFFIELIYKYLQAYFIPSHSNLILVGISTPLITIEHKVHQVCIHGLPSIFTLLHDQLIKIFYKHQIISRSIKGFYRLWNKLIVNYKQTSTVKSNCTWQAIVNYLYKVIIVWNFSILDAHAIVCKKTRQTINSIANHEIWKKNHLLYTNLSKVNCKSSSNFY